MAEAVARHFWGDVVEASSAGLVPLGYIPVETLGTLRDAGISTSGLHSKGLSDVMLGEFDYLINLTEIKIDRFLPDSMSGKLINCPIRDPFGHDVTAYRQVRSDIEKLIRGKMAEWEKIEESR